MQQVGKLQSGIIAQRATWKCPKLLCRPAGAPMPTRTLRVRGVRQPDYVDLPSAPPLRDDAELAERLPHQRSVGLIASTSQPAPEPSSAETHAAQSHESSQGFDLLRLLEPKYTFLLGGLVGGLGMDMSKPGSVLQAVSVLAAIVAVHEAGHFLAARLQGIRVTRFAVGFGPTLFKYKGPEVEYCLNAIPLGGYVAFPDDELEALAASSSSSASSSTPAASTAAATTTAPTASAASASASASAAPSPAATSAAPDASAAASAAAAPAPAQPQLRPDDPDLLKNRPIPQRALVISAGVIANLLFAYLVLLAQISTVGKAETAFLPGVRVEVPNTAAAATSAAVRAGLRSGDVILRIGDVAVPAAVSQVAESVGVIRASAGREVALVVQRGGAAGADGTAAAAAEPSGEVLTLRCTPDGDANGVGRIGVTLTSNTYIRHIYPKSTTEVLAMTQSEFNRLCGTVLGGLQQIVTNFGAMSGQLSGPVAIVAAGSEVLRLDSAGLYQFAAIVNINLAAVNILPLPALDGGYLLLLGLEALRGGRKLPAAVEQGVMASGFLVLTALGLGLVVRDTLNLL